jgi:hypothetical protein
MVLGAINPINVNVIKDRITTTQNDPSKIQTFATKTEQIVDYSKGVSPAVEPTNYMDTLKKYAPYIIGAVLLYYVISKK